MVPAPRVVETDARRAAAFTLAASAMDVASASSMILKTRVASDRASW